MRMPHICFVITEDWYFWSHRRILAQYLLQRGCRVDVVTSAGKFQARIEAAGMMHHSVGLQRRGKNPLSEAQTIRRMTALFRELQPDVVHLVGMKPILYGSLAARLAKVPTTICAIAGLGWLFAAGGIVKSAARRIVQGYFQVALAHESHVRFIVQNSHHRELLIDSRMAAENQIALIPGAGVDTNRFAYTPEPNGVPTVITHARMLWDKGVGDLVEAARLIRQRNLPCRFLLVGDPDPANPSSIPESQLHQWNDEGVVQWNRRRDDIPKILAESHIACLPSHHEGFPLSLVEAASCGRPIVTTDIPGCRDVVRHGETGLLVPRGESEALANALSELIRDPMKRQELGERGRRRVQQSMSCRIVNEQTFECYEQVLNEVGRPRVRSTPAQRAA